MDPAQTTQERIDLGNTVFVAAFFVPLVLGSVSAIVGAGVVPSLWVALFGVFNLFLLAFMASQLHAGKPGFEMTVWAIGGAFFLIAVATFFAGGQTLESAFLAFEALMPTLFAAIAAMGPTRDYLRIRRGEQVEEVVRPPLDSVSDEPLFVAAEEGDTVSLRSEAESSIGQCSKVHLGLATMLILCGVGAIAFGGYSLYMGGSGVMLILVGLFSIPTGLVLQASADDWSYLGSVKGHEKAHFHNIVRNTQTINYFAMGAVAIVMVLLLIDLALR